MAVTYKYDSFGTARPLDTNNTELMTLDTGEELIGAEVVACNVSSSDVTIRVGYGMSTTVSAWLCYDFTLYANLFVRFYIPGLAYPNKIIVRTSSADNVFFSISGLKKTTT